MATINDVLPPELLERVFTFCPLSDRICLSEVCEQWHNIIYHGFRTVKHVDVDERAHQFVCSAGHALFESVNCIRTVVASADAISGLLALLCEYPRLKQLHVVCTRHLSSSQITCTKLPRLDCLEHLHCDVHQPVVRGSWYLLCRLLSAIQSTERSSLRVIKLTGVYTSYYDEIDSTLTNLIRNSPHVTILSLNGCTIFKRALEKLVRVVASNLMELERLDVRKSNIDIVEELVKTLKKGSMKKLSCVGFNSEVEDKLHTRAHAPFMIAHLRFIALCPQMKRVMVSSLTISHQSHVDMLLLFARIDIDLLCLMLSSEALDSLAQGLAQNCNIAVRELHVSRNYRSDDDSQWLVSVVRAFRELKCIRASRLQFFTGHCLLDIITAMSPGVEMIDVQGASDMTTSLMKLLNNVPAEAVLSRRCQLKVLASDSARSDKPVVDPVRRVYCGPDDMILVQW